MPLPTLDAPFELKSRSHPTAQVRFGDVVELELSELREGATVRVLLEHRPILYLKELVDWGRPPTVALFPEAQGDYTVVVQWRDGRGASGVERWDFRVGQATVEEEGPGSIRLDDDTVLWGPSAWELEQSRQAEERVLESLSSVVRAGDVVYDLGANIGRYSVRLAQLCGPGGSVLCFEANPVCLYFLRTNLALNRIRNATVLPTAVLNSEESCAFGINYGNLNVGLTAASGFFGGKVGHEIQVPCTGIDRIIEQLGLELPDFVKIDIEGSEHLALEGMRSTLDRARPGLLMELHGREYRDACLELLATFGYRYRFSGSPEWISGEEVVASAESQGVFQLFAASEQADRKPSDDGGSLR